MNIKDGASIQGVQWQMFHAALVAEQIYKKFGVELIITAGTDGQHMNGSLHYKGMALDMRTNNVQGRELQVKVALQQALGKDYDVVLEKDHVHVEYDPRP